MGDCSILNSAFIGTVNSNTFAGGIIGSGYNGYGSDGVNSAPNTPVVSVQNCYVAGNISGKGAVGGIMGTEPSCECCWSNGVGTISNNHFYGTLNETSGTGYVGGIVGFMKSFNKYQSFENNIQSMAQATDLITILINLPYALQRQINNSKTMISQLN